MKITCGIDWAEVHHDVAVLDAAGQVLDRRRIETGLAGFTELMALLAEHTDDPASVPVAIETDKNLIVAALQAAGVPRVRDQPTRCRPVTGTARAVGEEV